ncbi:histidine phosphatase superfamily [Zychaea mexicana]|uniref:histidine phosphatase superfamily n=1 Tax=Zychaea mexicana TaxID=64656 RepID=UPI0022FF1468|nr:histidine phosphatase superfamily [Zychaea mexicana]KAI9469327.1 histidine phosphatase superfamily [Zychaea mexicana]
MQILFPTLALTALSCWNVLVLPAYGQYLHEIDWVKRHLATKSPYPVPDSATTDAVIRGYTLEQLQLVVRHGRRYPSDGDTEDIGKVLKKLQQSNNRTALDWLDNYENVYTPERSGSLDENGQLEQYLHGRRVAKRFPKLIDAIFDQDVPSGIDSASSESARTLQSATAFHMGLFEGQGALGRSKQFAVPSFMYPTQGDKLISIDDNCPRWDLARENSNVQSDLYGAQTQTVTAQRLSEAFGVYLTADDVEAIYSGCCFDVAHRNRPDTFCSLLSRQEILEAEYREDLSYFYKYSYGGLPLNGQVACALMQSIMNHIENEDTRLVLKVGHTQTVLFLQTFLGVSQNKQMLYANSSQSVIDQRVFRTSNIATMASNVEFQLLSKGENRFVRVLVSEIPVLVPGCKGEEICPLQTFKEALSPKIKCDFDEVCQG